MYNDEKEHQHSEAENTSNNVMSAPQVLQHSDEPVMQRPIKLIEIMIKEKIKE